MLAKTFKRVDNVIKCEEMGYLSHGWYMLQYCSKR